MAATATELDRSVYIADKDLVKIYPRDMSTDQIDFDLHTTVRGKTSEDYHVNFLPLNEVQQAWKFIELNGAEMLKAAGETPPAQVAKGVGAGLRFEREVIDPALKLAVSDPAYAFGFRKETSPQTVADTYKPWLDLWRESAIGSKLTKVSDEALSTRPLPIAAIPWFFAEFVPDQLLEFGTRASSWVGIYGIEKFGPPVINAALSKLPAPVRAALLRDIFAGEKALVKEFETLGIQANSRTSQVVDAYRKGARVTHPDLGGDPNEFAALTTAYQKIMQARSGWTDRLFDIFRRSAGFKKRAGYTPSEPRGLLGLGERGSGLIPFGEGDLVRLGKDVGRVVKVTGQVASVNIAGKVVEAKLNEISPVPGPATEESAVNLARLKISDEAKANLEKATAEIKANLEKSGKPLTHEEVIKKAKEAEVISQGVSREATLEFQANLLKTRQHLAALAEQNELTPEFLDTLRVMANLGTDIARNLESFKIEAMPEFAQAKTKVIKNIMKLGKSSEEILKAAKGVDFANEQAVAKFYRRFVKPTLPELLDEYVYINILSSPLTHIVNTFSNLLQLVGLNPLTKLASGGIDFVGSKLTGAERVHYVSSVPIFYKGALNALPKAFGLAADVMAGKKHLERPDVKHLPTLSKLIDWGTLKVGKYVTRALEASDVLFRTMIEAGEIEAMSRKLGHPPDEKELKKIQKEARKRAEYYVFRAKPDAANESGQGHLLSAIDQLTNAIYRLRAVPGFKWFIRFVQTPMNIVKQGIEYSPAGFATLPGAKDKTEQAAKAVVGSMVFAGASWLAANNLTTWASPTGEKDKNMFFSSGLQPYSIRIGDTWLSYSKLGPLSYPIAMTSALHYFTKESPNALSDSDMDKIVDALTGIMRFFSDQSYMRGLGDMTKFAHGEKTRAVTSVPTQLIPLSSLQGWVNNLMDPIQRKAEKGLSIESVVDRIQMKIVGMSQFVPAMVDTEEIPVKRQMRIVNAFSPLRMSKVDRGKLAEYRENVRNKQEYNRLKKEAEG